MDGLFLFCSSNKFCSNKIVMFSAEECPQDGCKYTQHKRGAFLVHVDISRFSVRVACFLLKTDWPSCFLPQSEARCVTSRSRSCDATLRPSPPPCVAWECRREIASSVRALFHLVGTNRLHHCRVPPHVNGIRVKPFLCAQGRVICDAYSVKHRCQRPLSNHDTNRTVSCKVTRVES